MTKFNEKKFEDIIQESPLLADHIDVPYITSAEQFDSEEDLVEYLQERVNECEVIYYTKAIDFLKEEDPSLNESLSLAAEYGYTLEKLDSEKLATILLQQKLNEELSSCDFSECFEE